jgi:hypothetical protein
MQQAGLNQGALIALHTPNPTCTSTTPDCHKISVVAAAHCKSDHIFCFFFLLDPSSNNNNSSSTAAIDCAAVQTNLPFPPKERKRDAHERCVVCTHTHTHTHTHSLVQYLSRYMYNTCTNTYKCRVPEYINNKLFNSNHIQNIFHVISSIAHLLNIFGFTYTKVQYLCTYICIHYIISMHIHTCICTYYVKLYM